MTKSQLHKNNAGPRAPASSHPAICAREICEADFHAMAEFFGQGLNAPAGAYLHILKLLRDHCTPAGYPKYGYLLEAGGSIVGGIILIFSSIESREGRSVRSHLTAWYVDPGFRSYAALFTSRALRHKDVTYMNLSARPAARPIIEAQGFIRYVSGQFVFVLPVHRLLTGGKDGKIARIEDAPEGSYEPFERDLLLAHEKYGNICFWILALERAYPFVFQRRFIKRVIPGVQLLYCRDITDLVRFSAPIGLHLLLRGRPLICVDSNAPIPGLPGKFFEGIQPRWYKGPKPRIGDLAYMSIGSQMGPRIGVQKGPQGSILLFGSGVPSFRPGPCMR